MEIHLAHVLAAMHAFVRCYHHSANIREAESPMLSKRTVYAARSCVMPPQACTVLHQKTCAPSKDSAQETAWEYMGHVGVVRNCL